MSNDSLHFIGNASSIMDPSVVSRLTEPANSTVPSTTLLAAFNFDLLLNYILFFLLFFIIVLFFILYLEMKSPSNSPYVDLERHGNEEDERERQKRREAINRAIHAI